MANYDVVIIGGGFYGARIAVGLARLGNTVLVLERDNDLMQRASYVNQARAHGGYHYPRSLLTALRSRVNLPVFSQEYANCIDSSFDQYYAIAKDFSKVSHEQFRLFCERIQAPISRAPEEVRGLFNPDLIDDTYIVEEYAFDANKIKVQVMKQMDETGVKYITGAEVLLVKSDGMGLGTVYLENGSEVYVTSARVLNCTYSRINALNRSSGLPEIKLKHEITELALVVPPLELEGKGFTVMCGPFFSIMPFPAKDLYSLSHVRYTPHTEWHEPSDAPMDSYKRLADLTLTSAYPKMIADAQRYMPSLKRTKYIESLYEVKTVLPQSENDDSRPILFKADHGLPGYTCIMGGKIDNIYDVLKEFSTL